MHGSTGYAIEVENVGVRFNLRMNRRNTLRRTVLDLLRGVRGESGHFWALRDLSFRVKQGEMFGIIGANGSGKSTLLLVLAGILRPDTGSVRVNGRVSTLLTLGAGFDQDLTGRENIFLSGAFLGLTKPEIEAQCDEIIRFSELGDFINVPVRRYSSGMGARLGFAIATSIEPDILLLDEVLGVGDASFQEKSKSRLLQLINKANAIVLVSHGMAFVKEMCTTAVWLQDGRVAALGDAAEVTEAYTDWVRSAKELPPRPVRLPTQDVSGLSAYRGAGARRLTAPHAETSPLAAPICSRHTDPPGRVLQPDQLEKEDV